MSARDPGGCFFDNDPRIKYARWLGFTYSEDQSSNNTDRGVVYYTATNAGGTISFNFYSEPTMQSGSLVASGSATASSTEWTLVSITEDNSSNLSGAIKIDLTTDSSSITAGKMIITFSFDYDLQIYEKKIADWAPSNLWEGEGTTGCAFVRAHRSATSWAIHELLVRLKGQVNSNSRNLPDLFDMDLALEELRSAAVMYAMYQIYWNQKVGGSIETDSFAQSAIAFKQEAEKAAKGVTIHLDTNNDGCVDAEAVTRKRKWK